MYMYLQSTCPCACAKKHSMRYRIPLLQDHLFLCSKITFSDSSQWKVSHRGRHATCLSVTVAPSSAA